MASWAFSRWSLTESRQLLINDEINLKPLLTDRFPIEGVVAGFENARQQRGVKSVLVGG